MITREIPERRLGRPPRSAEGQATIRILAAATPIFLSDGYEAASIDSIAIAAGISKKTFYVRFTSKADLFQAVCVSFIESRMPQIEREAALGGTVSISLRRVALAMLQAALLPEIVAFQRIVTAEAVRFPEFARTMHDFGNARIAALVEVCLETGVRRGEIEVDDYGFAVDYFLNVTIRPPFDRAVMGMERPEMTHVKRETLNRSVDFFLRSCRPGQNERRMGQAEGGKRDDPTDAGHGSQAEGIKKPIARLRGA